MKKSALIAGSIIVLATIAGGAIYAAGAGMFGPCAPLSLARTPVCVKLIGSDDLAIQRFVSLQNGQFLAFASQEDGASSLVELDARDGSILSSTPLSLPSDASAMVMAVSEDQSRVALSRHDATTVVLDRASGDTIAEVERYNQAFLGFSPDNRLLTEYGTYPDGLPLIDQALAYDLDDTQAVPTAVPRDVTAAMFASGVSAAISPDHRYFAQAISTPRASGLAAIRVGFLDRPDFAGSIFGTTLSPQCTYGLPRIAFSPDGNSIAAAFSCSARWGITASAMVVWDIDRSQERALVPTTTDWRQIVWLDNDTIGALRRDGLYRIDL